MCDLDYESALERPTPFREKLLAPMGAVVLGVIHCVYCAVASFQLFRIAGGITTSGRWTQYGGIDCAWTNVAWLPGGVLLLLVDGPSPVNLLAFLLLLAGSVFAGFITTKVGVAVLRGSHEYGRYHWQAWACALAWLGWIPVPVRMTLTYWHTVAY